MCALTREDLSAVPEEDKEPTFLRTGSLVGGTGGERSINEKVKSKAEEEGGPRPPYWRKGGLS